MSLWGWRWGWILTSGGPPLSLLPSSPSFPALTLCQALCARMMVLPLESLLLSPAKNTLSAGSPLMITLFLITGAKSVLGALSPVAFLYADVA